MSTILLTTATDPEILQELGRRLAALRQARRMSQTEAAERSGLSRKTVYSAEQGENPRLLTLVRLLRTYGTLDSLSAFIPETEISPIEILERTRGEG
ncbi:MAG: helix-turn-helix transcriptional regulator [Gemmatimonadota bacterium]